MGHWGVKSYENDDADFAIDRAFERVHGDAYEAIMDDRDPTPFDEAQSRLANPQTLALAVEQLRREFGDDLPLDDWNDDQRLAFAGVVVRHAEFGVPIPPEWLDRALDWLESEAIEWDEATIRRLRRSNELERLRQLKSRADAPAPPEQPS